MKNWMKSSVLTKQGIWGCLALVLVALVAFPSPSNAYGRDHHYWRPGWGWGPYPYAYPYPYPYPYAYPPAYASPPPIVVVPQAQVAPMVVTPAPQVQAPGSSADAYYYCKKPKGYYPYVQKCSVDWKLVPTAPPTGRVSP